MAKTRWFYTNKGTFKGLLFVIALILVVSEVWYIQVLVRKLREDQRQIVQLYIQQYQKVFESGPTENLSFLFDTIIRNIPIPAIVSSSDGEPLYHAGIDGIEEPYSQESRARLLDMIGEMDSENPPIEIMHDSTVVNMFHYGDSALIQQLNWLPAVQVIMVGLLIMLGFIGFNNIRRSEQRFIWIGMAKETAHQLGTPISALGGWLELLKQNRSGDTRTDILSEMSKDVSRMTKVAQRFSQIGSSSDYVECELSEVLHDIAEYFRFRLPQTGKAVTIEENYQEKAVCRINRDLFEWAVENLVKNGLDAIENGRGSITMTLSRQQKDGWIVIDIADTGKGMTKKQIQQIFKPGFSTKKRGWGLGLNLTKRIVEDFHNGRLLVLSSKTDEGTVMRIMIKGAEPEQ
ncbi:ATP-binding protein [candidate division KSB1 bacterium]